MVVEPTQFADTVRPNLVSTAIMFCVPHQAVGHERLDEASCRFRQLFYLDPEPADPWAALGLRDGPHGCRHTEHATRGGGGRVGRYFEGTNDQTGTWEPCSAQSDGTGC